MTKKMKKRKTGHVRPVWLGPMGHQMLGVIGVSLSIPPKRCTCDMSPNYSHLFYPLFEIAYQCETRYIQPNI